METSIDTRSLVKYNKDRKAISKTSELTDCQISIVLVESSLCIHKSSSGKMELLTEDKKIGWKEVKNQPTEARPDIVHNCLLMILDSPLCKSGYLSEVIILNYDGKIISVNPIFRVPRSFKIFEKVFVNFLSSNTGVLTLPDDSQITLLKLLNPPLHSYIKENNLIIGFSRSADIRHFPQFVEDVVTPLFSQPSLCKICCIVGAISNGNPVEKFQKNEKLLTHCISISNYSMPASICCSRICSEIEEALGIF
ncbi:nucleolar essential protein 1 [Cryptosporidium andersoni]|uniref:Nucleolar essential protein 1 n=1 Tax=Cryptosporidium andersoni TaxID=117008 RepID=A0A1J4MW94_9CRYT|nr:nucleolar essential protein 1 [Cryptosporidium andersoni]